jgi:hypothetical protein
MNFMRNPAWIGSLGSTTQEGPGNWVLISTWDISNGGADGSTYSTGFANVVASSDYAITPRVWVDAGGRPGKSIRFVRNSEVGGGNHSHYRAYLYGDNTYLTNINMLTEGRITFDIRIPPQANYRGNVFTDPQVWWLGGLIDAAPRYLYFGFDGNATTFGLWNTTDTTFAIASNASIALGVQPTGWLTVDFRYRLHASTGYVWVKLGSYTPIYLQNQNTTGGGAKTLYGMGCGSLNGATEDLTYFGSMTNLKFYAPV